MLKRMDNLTKQQKSDAEKRATEEHNTILFMTGADEYKYGKLIEDMKKDVLRKKDSFKNRRSMSCAIQLEKSVRG